MGRRNFFILKTFHRIIVSTIIKADADRPMKSQKKTGLLYCNPVFIFGAEGGT